MKKFVKAKVSCGQTDTQIKRKNGANNNTLAYLCKF